MKGLVFTELLTMAESVIGEDAVDDILDALDLGSDGAYSAVGNYPCSELMKIVGAISDLTGLPGDVLQHKFGGWMFARFVEGYPQFFAGKTTSLDMLETIEGEVHVEVRKLYPDAELPRFETQRSGDGEMVMTYVSDRPLVSFCHGLIEACIDHFNETGSVQVKAQPESTQAAFKIHLDQAA